MIFSQSQPEDVKHYEKNQKNSVQAYHTIVLYRTVLVLFLSTKEKNSDITNLIECPTLIPLRYLTYVLVEYGIFS